MSALELVGRSSSHYTRTARIFALELEVAHRFRPVFDLATAEPAAYAGNPALKIPILMLPDGPLFGTENICRELERRSTAGKHVVQRGAIADRRVANAEELVLHAMSTEVTLIMAKAAGHDGLVPPKARASLENVLRELDAQLDSVLALLPSQRALSFLEVTLYCLVRHLPFREILDVDAHQRLAEFCMRFEQRDAARQTTYRFDSP